jgi:hypothetical protein
MPPHTRGISDDVDTCTDDEVNPLGWDLLVVALVELPAS